MWKNSCLRISPKNYLCRRDKNDLTVYKGSILYCRRHGKSSAYFSQGNYYLRLNTLNTSTHDYNLIYKINVIIYMFGVLKINFT